MYTHSQHGQIDQEEIKRMRKEAGVYLKDLRQRVKLTQKDLADAVGMEYYTAISQIETGTIRMPPDRIFEFAKALRVPAHELAEELMKFYDPVTYRALKSKR